MGITIGVLITAHGDRVRNGMLSEALASVTSQTRLPDQIVVALDRDRELGAAGAKQAALNGITTDFTAVLDSDDYFLSNHLEVLERAQLETSADLVYSWFHTIPPGLDPFPTHFFTDPWDPDNPRHTTTTILGRTSLMKRVGYREIEKPGWHCSEDDWLMSMGMIELGAKVYHIPERTWVWRMHGGNTSGLPIRRNR